MIRVLQISDSLKQRFGVTAYLMNYNSAIDSNKVVFDYLIIDSEKEIIEKITSLGGRIYTMPKLGLTNAFDFIKVIKEFFHDHHYDIVHSHFYQVDMLIQPIAMKNGTKHYISHAHATKYADSTLRTIRNFAMSYPVRFIATDFCGCSKSAGDFLFGTLVLKSRNKRMNVIPNAIDYEKFYFDNNLRKTIRKRYNLFDKNVYGHIGSFKPPKNHDFLLDVFHKICQIDDKAMLMLVGDGDLRKNIRNKANKLGIVSRIVFVGTTDTPQEYYNAFDCYVFPSIYEGFGLSLLEAEVNGLPCVCSNSVPKEPLISSSVKILSLQQTPAEWATICVRMLKMGRNEKKLSHKYDLPYAAVNMTKFYEGLSNA